MRDDLRMGQELAGPRPGDLDRRDREPWNGEDIDRALWEIAVCGGNVARAHRQLSDWADAVKENDGIEIAVPSRRTMSLWKQGSHRNRYHEICASRTKDLDEHLAQQHVGLALRAVELEQEAMRKIAERIDGVDATEASLILRNLSGAKKNAVDGAAHLRGNTPGHIAARGVSQVIERLVRLGVVALDEPIDAEVIE